MQATILGDGPMGRAVADELTSRGWPIHVLGRPRSGRHRASDLAGASVVIDVSIADSVPDNVDAALEAGVGRLVIGTTGWTERQADIACRLESAGATAVVEPTFSLGAAVLGRLVGDASRALVAAGGYDPWIVEWHRAGKRDRPSGTALGLAARLIETGAKRRIGTGASGPADPEALEVLSLRAGSSPGMHVVGFDAAGETLELRLTARGREPYAVGARLAAEWLLADHRAPGIHPFASVVNDLITTGSPS